MLLTSTHETLYPGVKAGKVLKKALPSNEVAQVELLSKEVLTIGGKGLTITLNPLLDIKLTGHWSPFATK